MKIFKSHRRSTESESLRVGHRHLCFNRSPPGNTDASWNLVHIRPSKKLFSWKIYTMPYTLLLNGCFQTVGLVKTLESPLDSKEIKPVHPKGNQPWIFIGRIDAKAEAPILWLPDEKSQLIGKDPDAGKDWRQEETENDRERRFLDDREQDDWTASPT